MGQRIKRAAVLEPDVGRGKILLRDAEAERATYLCSSAANPGMNHNI
ncbi:hypothetical protein [Oribacterium sp. oral taxon 078]|nr:hypothetical protein [Oribacterium sp. oral taxon 078]